uniref:Uncharacterized protein n=1 Tax=Steinernema glaseri TaxID=37863 RepID=A0A1I8ACB3_9BILA
MLILGDVQRGDTSGNGLPGSESREDAREGVPGFGPPSSSEGGGRPRSRARETVAAASVAVEARSPIGRSLAPPLFFAGASARVGTCITVECDDWGRAVAVRSTRRRKKKVRLDREVHGAETSISRKEVL